MPSSAFFTWLDRSAEKASMSFRIADFAGDGSNYAGDLTALATLESALDTITDGVIAEESIVATRTRLTNAVPATGKREQKWLVRYEDVAERRVYTLEIPCALDGSMPMATNSDFVDMNATSAARDALITAIEAWVVAPNGNAINVISIESVGRNT